MRKFVVFAICFEVTIYYIICMTVHLMVLQHRNIAHTLIITVKCKKHSQMMFLKTSLIHVYP